MDLVRFDVAAWACADALGIMVLDENRVFQIGLSPNMVDLVQRDRCVCDLSSHV